MPELHKCAGIYRENFCGGEDLLEYILDLLENLPSNLILRLSIISYIIKSISKLEDKKEITTKILRRIRFKNTVIKKINLLIQEDWKSIDFSKKRNIRQLASRIGMENLEDIWELKKAFIKESQRSEKSKSDEIKTGENNIRETLQEKPPVSYINLAVKGKDLLELGYKEGDKLGEILKKMLQIVIDNPELNEKKILLKIPTANEENVR
jgi:tRNA nucleotidyltransferase (CCA-adding enzyme)